MREGNAIGNNRSPKSQDDWSNYELKLIKDAHLNEKTADYLTKFIKRPVHIIRHKASMIGCPIKRG